MMRVDKIKKNIPVLIVCPDGQRDIEVGEYRQRAVRLRNNGSALNVLIGAKTDIGGRVARYLE